MSIRFSGGELQDEERKSVLGFSANVVGMMSSRALRSWKGSSAFGSIWGRICSSAVGYAKVSAQLHRFVDREEDEGSISPGFTTSKNNSPL